MNKEEDSHPIKFYKKDEEYGFFSNFYKAPFEAGGRIYATNEHYFQSKKFAGKAYENDVASAKTPFDAFELGRSRRNPLREDWEQVKDEIMYEGLRFKFSQNKDLKDKLLETGNRKIIEHTTKDKYWGDGGNGEGQNRLGILLMKLRD